MPGPDHSPEGDPPRAAGLAAGALVSEGSVPSSTTGAEDAGSAQGQAAPPGQPPRAMPVSFFALFTAVMFPMFLGAVDQTLLSTATPRIAAELGGLTDASWIAVGYLLAATISAPVYGRLGDRFGRRNVMLCALTVFILGSLACAIAPSMHLLISARVVQGLGGGGLMVLSQALIGEIVPPWDRPRYQGYFALVFTTSSVGGPLLGGFVVHHGDWRWLFYANLPLGLIAMWRIWSLPRPVASPSRHLPYDPVGFALFVACACSALLWFSQVGHRFGLVSTASAALAAGAVGCGVVLWRQQRRHPNPFLPLDILRLPGVGWICLSVIGFAGTMFALLFLLPIYLQVIRGGDALDAGLQLLPLTFGIVVGSTINGRVSARTARTGVLPPFGLGAAALALLALALLPATPMGIAIAAGVCGIGFGTVMPNAQLGTQMLAGRSRLGASAALLSLTRSTGASVGTAAFGGLALLLLAAPGGGAPGRALRLDGVDPAQAAHAFHLVFGALAAFALLGAVAASRAPRVALKQRDGQEGGR